MPVHLRAATAADLPFITTLERLPENREHIGQWTDDEHRQAIEREKGREHWIIERDDARAGYLIAYDATDRAAGIYVKRILVADKERGTGTAALTCFLDDVCARKGVEFVWLLVRERNERGQAVYRKLGMRRYDPSPEEAARWDATVDPAGEGVFRMRIEASAWRRSRAR